MKLYHYTCDHGSEKIARSGQLLPNGHPWLPVPVIWLTDMERPDREALGLTSQTIRCDRTAWRVSVDTDEADPWHVFARRYRVSRSVREELEFGRLPMAWFVSLDPIPVDLRNIRALTEGAA